MDPVDLLVAIASLLTVVAGVVTAAFWPAVVLIVALVFRAELTTLLRRVESLDAAGVRPHLRAGDGAADLSAQAVALSTQPVELHEEEGEGGQQEEQGQEGSGEESPVGGEDRQGGPTSDVLAASAVDKRRQSAVFQLQRIRPADVLEDLEALNEQGMDPILAVVRAEQVATEQINEIARVIARKHPQSGIPKSPAAARRILRDAGVVGPNWETAWLHLQAARNGLVHRGEGFNESEAHSWISLAHRLVSQAKTSAIGAVAVGGILDDEEEGDLFL